jgi:hypothetical protein
METTGRSGKADARSIFRTPLKLPELRVRRRLVDHHAGARTAGAVDCRVAVRDLLTFRPDIQI